MIVSAAIRIGEERLSSGSDSPRRDCEILLCHVLGKSREFLYAWPEYQLTSAQHGQFTHLLEKRHEGEPIAYLTGHKEFWGQSLIVDQGVLIPRPETELLVESVLEKITIPDARVADLGTGSGAIALALASERPNWEIHAVDSSQLALNVASQNAKNLGLDVFFAKGSWCDGLAEFEFDAIVSNPPYIDPTDIHLDQGDVRFEPRSALVSGQNGMADLSSITGQAIGRLKSGGWLMLEHGYQQGAKCRKVFISNGYCNIETRSDLAGLERITLAQKP